MRTSLSCSEKECLEAHLWLVVDSQDHFRDSSCFQSLHMKNSRASGLVLPVQLADGGSQLLLTKQ
jgi:hypothetical protein